MDFKDFKPKKSKLTDTEIEAKKSVLGNLKNMATEAMGSKLDGLKKVTVASDSKMGLKEGLEKAKEVLGKMPEVEDSKEHEDVESPDMEKGEEEGKIEAISQMCEECDESELKDIIAKLQEMLDSKSEPSLEA